MTRQDLLCTWLQTLSPLEEAVLRSRFGIQADAGDLSSPRAITASWSAESLRQIEGHGLRHLRRALPMLAVTASNEGITAV